MDIPQNMKHRITNDEATPLLGTRPEELKVGSQRNMCTPKRGTQPKVHQQMMDKSSVVHPYHGILFRLKKEGDLDTGSSTMDLEDSMLNEISRSKSTNDL